MKNELNQAKYDSDSRGKLLAMDTATTSMSVALLEDGRILKELSSVAERNHSIYLVTSVQQALAELGWTTRELQGIAVGRGPGSYTGVRIGVTVAKTMAWTLGLPVVGVSSLEAMAGGGWMSWSRSGTDRGSDRTAGSVWIVPMMNARRGQVFTAHFELNGPAASAGEAGDGSGGLEPADGENGLVYQSGWTRKQEDGIRLMEQWADRLLEELRGMEKPPATVLFTGETDDFAPVIERFKVEAEDLGSSGILTAALPYGIHAQYIGYLGARRLAAGDYDDVHGLLPNYTQLPEAEVKLLAKKKQ